MENPLDLLTVLSGSKSDNNLYDPGDGTSLSTIDAKLNLIILLDQKASSNLSPIPKLGALFPKLLGRVYVISVSCFLTDGNRGPLPNENFYVAVEKLVTSN
jgi:hypothetical protein